MKKVYLSCAALLAAATLGQAQTFPEQVEVEMDWLTDQVVLPPSPLKYQVLFVGNTDEVQTVDANGQPNGTQPAKQWHDFIGFTPASEAEGGLGWVSVNHEMILADDKIGDGGGMTVFKVARDADTDTLVILEQTLDDGRTGKFFNVDFVNTVGETGMNCGGITSNFDGRIWTAEEWFRSSTSSIYRDGDGVRDTADFTISAPEFAGADYDGQTIQKFENFNWMVEIDPREAKAIRKQYNWGRQGFEGGVVLPDNQTVYTGEDGTPGLFSKFVADTPGDFTSGTLYVYDQDGGEGQQGNWIEYDNSSLDNMLSMKSMPYEMGATMFNRIEWVAYNETDGKVYFTETGRDTPGGRWAGEMGLGGQIGEHHRDLAIIQEPGLADVSEDSLMAFLTSDGYKDYYGRVMVYDPATDEVEIYINGGPFLASSPSISNYPEKHLSNPDGLNFMYVNDKTYMVINEDLNGTSFGRVPAGLTNRTCELYLLDMDEAAEVDNLIRISVTPLGAEVTGACPTPDGQTLLVNSQHPNSGNPFPYNNSLTYAITGWADITTNLNDGFFSEAAGFQIWPNPTARELHFSEVTDVAIYSINGQRLKVFRNVKYADVSDLAAGTYIVRNAEGEMQKLVVQ